MKNRAIISCLIALLACVQARTQAPISGAPNPASNLRRKLISTRTDSIRIDTLSIVPASFVVEGIPAADYTLDGPLALLYWKKKPPADSVWLSYRVFPFRLYSIRQRFRYDSVMNNFLASRPFEAGYFTDGAQAANLFNFGKINYNGSFGRGVSFGNNQDAVVNSNFNLQLNGFLGDSIEISAAITDTNIPIQPDGNTQQLNEFDRIWLQFKKRGWELNLGDIDIRQNQSYFLNFFKRLQGIAFQTENKITPLLRSKALVSGSIAKGKFTRNIFLGEEGNQGPYRLSGANNELFFVVLAGSERVFIDGEPLQRGEDQDYVIDYNTAEIRFTPRRMINKDRRIQVEFEYADRNFLNSNIYATEELSYKDKMRVFISVFSNSDSKNSSINQVLDEKQRQFLADIGDGASRAYYPNAARDTFSTGKILYAKRDTIAGTFHDSVYVYSTSPDSARYSLSFADLGQGNGNYIPLLNGANGKVFKWVAPVNGVMQGRYEPVILLVAPRQQQVMSVGMEYKFSPKTTLLAEGAMSKWDINTLSRRDKGNDRGFAGKLEFKHIRPVAIKGKKKTELQTDLAYEVVEDRFRPLERLRQVEFGRDWGLDFTPQPATENIATAGFTLSEGTAHVMKYQYTGYWRQGGYRGNRHSVQHQLNNKGWLLKDQVSYTRIVNLTNQGYFLRPTVELSKTFKKWKNHVAGGNYSLEHTELRKNAGDSVTPGSFSFDIKQLFFRSADDRPNKYGITYYTRTDRYPLGKNLLRGDRSQNITLNTELMKSEHHRFRFNSTYRSLEVFDTLVARQQSDKSLLGRVEYEVNEFRGLLTGSVLYEVGSGQEQRRDFTFIEVPAGQGEFTWIDYNSDGIPQLNEFEVARFPDQMRYIRLFTPTNNFVKANYTQFNYGLTLNPRAAINMAKAKGLRKFISRINLQSSLQLSRKQISDGSASFNPFSAQIADTALITASTVFANTFSFNRYSSVWGVDLSNIFSNGKSLLTYGFEGRRLRDYTIRWRWNLNKELRIECIGKKGENILETPKFGNRNFSISQYSAEPQISYTRGTSFRIQAGYKYSNKKNAPEYGGQQASSNALNAEAKYNILSSTSLSGKFTFSNISFPATLDANSTVGFIMLEGLQRGKNYIWNLDLTKRLGGNMELNFRYDGRKSGTARVVHTGNASLRALF